MAGFRDLPPECIVMVLSCLRPHHIEKLARTFNRRVTNLCLPLLKDRVRTALNHRVMKQLFGEPTMADYPQANYKKSLLGSQARFSIPERPADHLEYLQMDGYLDWLVPLDRHTADRMAPHWQGSIRTIDIESLRETTRELGIHHAVPKAFWRLMEDAELQARVPSTTANFFILSPISRILTDDLVEVYQTEEDRCILRDLSEDEDRHIRETRAYILDFYSDQQGCGYWHLYLDSKGHHCVLTSPSQISRRWNTDDDDRDSDDERVIEQDALDEKEKKLNVQVADSENVRDLCLEATDFETWLALTYFSHWTRFIFYRAENFKRENDREWVPGQDTDLTVPTEVTEFLVNVYTEEGRNRQLLL